MCGCYCVCVWLQHKIDVLFLFFLDTKPTVSMEAVITYIKGFPKKTRLTYRRIEDDVVERIVRESNKTINDEGKVSTSSS